MNDEDDVMTDDREKYLVYPEEEEEENLWLKGKRTEPV